MAAELLRIDMADGAAVDFRQPCRLDQQQTPVEQLLQLAVASHLPSQPRL